MLRLRKGLMQKKIRVTPKGYHPPNPPRQLRSPTEDLSVSAALCAPGTLEALCDNVLYLRCNDIIKLDITPRRHVGGIFNVTEK